MSEYDQSNLDLSTETPSGPVECLGQTFESDDARREHYTELLREKLKDPEFRKIEGFPIGEDEDILALSDPPYYTACPNPWIEDFVKHHGRPYDPDEKYHREPFAADVSEGKNHPIYNAHSYHTKVPHRAIMRYILHYTEPGDLVFDGFCGSGMTGVAAQLCGDQKEVQELGYRVDQDGSIFDKEGKAFSKLGARIPILNDLSPLATFITKNYNTPECPQRFGEEVKKILNHVQEDCLWMYQTKHNNGEIGTIICTIWSDMFVCPECSNEFVLWDAAVDKEKGEVKDAFNCFSCNSILTKKTSSRVFSTQHDSGIGEAIRQAKAKPVEIIYKVNGKRYSKKPDYEDLKKLEEINNIKIKDWYPSYRMPKGGETRRNDPAGITHTHHFYSKRNLYALAKFSSLLRESKLFHSLQYQFDTLVIRQSKLSRLLASYYFHGGGGWVGGPLSGTLYIPSFFIEVQPFETWNNRTKKTLARVVHKNPSVVSTSNAANSFLPDNSLDYLFFDPPFGANIAYSELSFLWESWLKIRTNTLTEAIQNKHQNKGLKEYRDLMFLGLREAFRVLKPGRWITVEFSNTSSAVWNSIQSALSQCGFIVANVSALDKKQGSFKAVTTTTAVKQDLVISAYKPSKQLELIFLEKGYSVEGVWQFIDSHLKQLPVSKPKGGMLEFVAERDPRILYDRMVAFYFGHGVNVPLSSGEFQSVLDDKYPDRDGMVFLPEQVAEHDRLAAKMESVGQMVVFVEDEKSAIGWLRQYLKDKPSTYSTINPDFMQQLKASWRKFETRPELSVLLDQNFLKYSGEGDVPSQIHSYLSTDYHDLRKIEKDDSKLQTKAKDRWYVPDPKKMADVEAQREKKLLAEFWEYAAQVGFERGQTQKSQTSLQLGDSAKKKPKVKKLKEVRTDAVRAGFMECQRNNQGAVILAVAEILPANVIEEDEQLQMIYDMAEMRAG